VAQLSACVRARAGGDTALAFGFTGTNKRKTLEAAQKYVQKGAYDKALKEYAKLLQADPMDTNVRLKIGDLQLKRKSPEQAITAYAEVAEIFSKDGFDAKAVAIYKQILRIDAAHHDARVRLGELYQRLGLVSDALREFQAAVRSCQERGRKREAFELLQRVARLDPTNVPNRLSLAHLLEREGMVDQARQEYESILAEAARTAPPETRVRAAEQMLQSFAGDPRALECLARAQIEIGKPEAAIDAVASALAALPDEIPLREVAVELYRAAGDEDSAQSVYRDLAELHRRRGDHDRSREILQRYVPIEEFAEPATPPSLALREKSSLSKHRARSLELPPEELTGMPVEELLAEARIALQFDNPEDAEARAEMALEADTTCDEARRILADAAIARGDFARALRVHEERRDLAAAAGDGLELSRVEQDLRELRIRAPELATAPSVSTVLLEEPLREPAPLERIELEPDSAPDLDPEPGSDELPDIEILIEDEHDSDDRFASIEPPTLLAADEPSPELELDSLIEIELEQEGATEPPTPARGSSWAADSTYVTERIDRAEHWFALGHYDEAEALYRAALERAPHHPQALLRLGEIATTRGRAPEAFVEPPSRREPASQGAAPLRREPPSRGGPPSRGEPPSRSGPPSRPASSPEPASRAPVAPPPPPPIELDVVAPGTPPRLAPPDLEAAPPAPEDFSDLFEDPAPPEGETTETVEADGGDFDLAAELAAEMGDDEPATSSGSGVETVFSAFKRGIQDQLDEHDCGARYDLGIAYREMGLLDDAVEQLELAARGGERRVESLAVLATTKLELDRPEDAVLHLREALALAGPTSPMTTGLRYELGVALTAAGERGEALAMLRQVAAVDRDFREVATRIKDLEATGR
jgi:tetratricopeptide (TPR) repeat protein